MRQPRGLGDLGQDGQEDAALHHQRHHPHRVLRDQQLEQLVGDAFARQRHQVLRARGAGLESGRIRRVAEAGEEAEEAQDAQMILGDALERIADEAHPARLEIGEAAEIVEDRSPVSGSA
jgi:hypothetical protein